MLFGLSSYKVKEELVRVLSNLSVSLQYSFILVVLPLIRLGSNHNSLCTSSTEVRKELRDSLRE